MISFEQFIRETIHRARTELSYQDAIKCMRGMCVAFDGEIEGLARVRTAVTQLSESDRQLELIAAGQLRHDFGSSYKEPLSRPATRKGPKNRAAKSRAVRSPHVQARVSRAVRKSPAGS